MSAAAAKKAAPRTVILANGDFPKKGGEAWRILSAAKRVVCCDGAADAYRRRFGKEPAVVVGDCDSLRGKFENVVRVAEQETNDLAKAARHCAAMGWKNPVVLGAAGKREDHMIANVFLALDLGLEVVTDFGRFIPVRGAAKLSVGKGAAVSVFAPDPATRISSKGLVWPLDAHVFSSLHSAALNRADADMIELTATRPALVYVAR